MDCYDLLTLQREIREGLFELFPDRVWVKAEIASMQVRTNGHCYLELVQSERGVQLAKVKAMIWSSRFKFLSAFFEQAAGTRLAAGQQIMARAQVNYSELYGLSLVIDDINAEFAVGDAELRKRQTIERLEKEGLMELQKELELPALPYSLAVISAPDAAGYGDFCRHLEENEYGFVFKVTLFPATMQGEKAPASVAQALAEIDPKQFDAALIMRGGGSRLDLACFDDYDMAAAIARCPIPVYTAIGHDRDHSVADMVAHAFVKTPTALADEFIDLYAQEDERLTYLANRLKLAFANKISSRLSRIDELERRIREADPRKVLQRGYSLIVDEGGHIVKEAASVKPGDKLRIMLADGTIEVNVDTVTSFPAPTGNLK